MPKIAYFIGALALLWFIVRLYTRRQEERRQAERDERMARLYAEREEMLHKRPGEEGPTSLGGVVSEPEPEQIKVRCKACRALNDESATECASCHQPL
jgi:hypothetical protein